MIFSDIDVIFNFDATALAGRQIVLFERLYLVQSGGALQGDTLILLSVDEKLDNLNQTVSFPDINTNMIDVATKSKTANYGIGVKFTDTIDYVGLDANELYVATGTLMDKQTNKPLLDKDGKPIQSTTEFRPLETDGTVDVTFTLDTMNYTGIDVVAYEVITRDGVIIAHHEDINDARQTVTIPGLSTLATGGDGRAKTLPAGPNATVIDTVTYSGLVVGETYTVVGTLMDKSTGMVASVNGNPLSVTGTFTPESPSGTMAVTFNFDASAFENKVLVIFEEVYNKDHILIGAHQDINDEKQAIAFTTTTIVQTGVESYASKYAFMTLGLLGVAAIIVIVKVRLAKARRKRKLRK